MIKAMNRMSRILFIFLVTYLTMSGAAFSDTSTIPSAGEYHEVKSGRVEGKVMFEEQPIGGVCVYAVPDPDGIFKEAPPGSAVISDGTGAFSLELPEGRYYIAARKGCGKEALEPGDLYCFYGGNPVVVDSARPATIVLHAVKKSATAVDIESSDDKGVVEGTITLGGKPLAGVLLNVYSDAKGSFRGRGSQIVPLTGEDGKFKIKLGEGSWYIMARKRMSGEQTGPLYEGDYFGYLDINPISVSKGKTRHVEIPVAKKMEKTSPGGHGYTRITGVVKDEKGKPASGMYVCLYKNKAMAGRPAIISKATGPDGVFKMELPITGKCFLGARSALGGPLAPGQYRGKFSGNPDHSINIEAGTTIEGLIVTVGKVAEQ